MATVTGAAEGRMVSMGRIFERTFRTIRHNPGPTIGLAFLFGAVPGLLTTYMMQSLQQPAVMGDPNFSMTGFYALTLLSVVLGLAISALTQAALTRATVAEAEGRKAGFGESIAAGVAVLLPLIALSILLAIGVMIGFVLLIVPGVILYCMWSVAVPSLVEERRGVFGSFGRSRELTDGFKWKVFGTLLVVMVVYWLASAVFGILMLNSVDLADPQAPFKMSTSMIVGSLILGTLVNLFWGLVQASLYVELRNAKDGPATDHLEEVFA
jgi:uncharacterized membrane protein